MDYNDADDLRKAQADSTEDAESAQRSDPDAEPVKPEFIAPCQAAATDGATPRYCAKPLGHDGQCEDVAGEPILLRHDQPEQEEPARIRVIELSELGTDPDGAKILATMLGYGCGECDACKRAAQQTAQAEPRPAGALDARVRILALPIERGSVVAGILIAPFVLVVDMLGTLEHVGAQEAFWTEHGKAMGARRTIVSAGAIDLDGAQL